MNKFACQYAIVRFMPFVETGEFANIGIVAMAARERFFDFRLAPRAGRITQFFDTVEATQYRAVVASIREEFERAKKLLEAEGFVRRANNGDGQIAKAVFAELTRTRESIVRFSRPRVALTDNLQKQIEALYRHYVEREFVTRESTEKVLENGVRQWLRAAQLQRQFHERKVGDDTFEVRFPFVEMRGEKPVKVIKPLFLGQPDSTHILEKGARWAFRVDELRKRNKMADKVMFTLAGPDVNAEKNCVDAFSEARVRLQDRGVELADQDDQQRVIEFARTA